MAIKCKQCKGTGTIRRDGWILRFENKEARIEEVTDIEFKEKGGMRYFNTEGTECHDYTGAPIFRSYEAATEYKSIVESLLAFRERHALRR